VTTSFADHPARPAALRSSLRAGPELLENARAWDCRVVTPLDRSPGPSATSKGRCHLPLPRAVLSSYRVHDVGVEVAQHVIATPGELSGDRDRGDLAVVTVLDVRVVLMVGLR